MADKTIFRILAFLCAVMSVTAIIYMTIKAVALVRVLSCF